MCLRTSLKCFRISKNDLEHPKKCVRLSIEHVLKKVEKYVFRKFQNMLSQNNDLKKTLIKSNKATKN